MTAPPDDDRDRVTLLRQKPSRGDLVEKWAAVLTLPARVRSVADPRRAAPGEATYEVKVRDFGPIRMRDQYLHGGVALSVLRVLDLDRAGNETLCFCEAVDPPPDRDG